MRFLSTSLITVMNLHSIAVMDTDLAGSIHRGDCDYG